VPSLRIVRDAVPEAVEAVIDRALARAPADRYTAAAAFSEALGAALRQPGPIRARPHRRRIALAGVVVVLVAAAVILFRGLPRAADTGWPRLRFSRSPTSRATPPRSTSWRGCRRPSSGSSPK